MEPVLPTDPPFCAAATLIFLIPGKLLVLGTVQLVAPGHRIYGSMNMLVNGTWMTEAIPCSQHRTRGRTLQRLAFKAAKWLLSYTDQPLGKACPTALLCA